MRVPSIVNGFFLVTCLIGVPIVNKVLMMKVGKVMGSHNIRQIGIKDISQVSIFLAVGLLVTLMLKAATFIIHETFTGAIFILFLPLMAVVRLGNFTHQATNVTVSVAIRYQIIVERP